MVRKVNATWSCEDGQDLAEYALMLALILVLVMGIVRLVGSGANNVFSNAARAFQSQTAPD